MRTVLPVLLASVLAAVTTCVSAAERKLTYVDLAGRLTDLERLAVLPQPGEKCMQWSSWDRRSQYDAKTGKYVHWHANGDGNGFIRKEGDSLVLAEMKGPGCIWRIWSAMPKDGHVKMYLDGEAKPAVDIPFKAYFDRTTAPFVHESLCYVSARGQNCYVPIPFQESCKIVAEKNWGRYYHFTYSLFPKGTEVETFKMDLSAEAKAVLKKTDTFFRTKMGTDPVGKRPRAKTEKKTVSVQAGKSATVLELTGPRAITALRVFGQFTMNNVSDPVGYDDEVIARAFRELVLRITWDDAKQPAVWCPLGDFFGTAPGRNGYRSFPMGMHGKDTGLYSVWYMPFARKAKIEILNDGSAARHLEFQISHAPLKHRADQLGRFHAKWHRDAFGPTKDRHPDWTMLKTTGRGRFVGVMLHVWNPKGGQCPAAGEGRYWWGEGDEKFFVDGEKFPSTFGTGSEDYFGYAWGNATLFQRAYHNQTISMGNRGHISLNRWHIVDNVPFQTRFEAAIEKYFPNDWPTRYACVAYWYQAGGKDPYGEVPVAQRLGWYEKPKVFRIKGAIEGERLKVLSRTGGKTQTQDMAGFSGGKWSENAHLWWTGAKPGDKLTLAVPVKADGKYEVKVQLTKAIDYGIVQLSLDGKKLDKPIDLFNDGVIPTGPLSLGTHELTKGIAKLGVEITGANPKAKKAYMFGLDYVLLTSK